MPSSLSPTERRRDIVTKFTNCLLVKDNELVAQDLWVSSLTGKILNGQQVFYGLQRNPDRVIDLGGRIVSPGLIDVQLNGAFGVNFSIVPEDVSTFPKSVRMVNRRLIETGVTSYLPTMTSQKSDTYHKLLPYLGPSGESRLSEDGAESLGAHCEGPFMSPTKNGIHPAENLQSAPNGLSDIDACYGAANFSMIKMVTAAPEVDGIQSAIPALASRGIVYSIGHSEATYEEASSAVSAGATMITHLFNAMRPLHHRNPGVFGVLGVAEKRRPYFGIIADGIHLHPTSIKIAFSTHPEGCVLVTDAMHLAGLEDGPYEWTNGGERIIKKGPLLTLEGSDKIAGSVISLIECVNNFTSWTGSSIAVALKTVTKTPATMLGLAGVKGTLDEGADADLVIFSQNGKGLVVDQVWKFGEKVFDPKFTI